MKFNQGDTICYSAAFVRQCGHDKETADMRGTVESVKQYGSLSVVTFVDTHGETRKSAANNLARVSRGSKFFADGVIVDATA